ncbi:MAG: glycosyl transferase [Pseudomonadota bacterium]
MESMDGRESSMMVDRKLAVFGTDAAEAAQVKRMDSYLACGFDVQGFMMRRANMNTDFEPFWNNLHLSDVDNENQLGRMWAVAKSIPKVIANRHLLRGTDIIVARNLDMLMIAAIAQKLAPTAKPRLIYECLDINNLMTGTGLKNRLFRWIERRLLTQTDTLMVSAPAFVDNYFAPVQGWTGKTVLVENKIWVNNPQELPRPTVHSVKDRPPISADNPLILGWIGTLRCQQSLDLLVAAAQALGPNVQIAMHGVVHYHAVPDFDATIAAHPNLVFHGPYAYPKGLAEVYDSCDLVWSQDMWQWGTNSTWLLPNRIYEASYFGCPSIAVAGTGTGDRVSAGLGWAIPEPSADALVSFLPSLTADTLTDMRKTILARPDSEFLQSAEEIRAALTATTKTPVPLTA